MKVRKLLKIVGIILFRVYRGNFKDEVRDEMLTNIFEASGATLNSFASFVNTATAIAKGPESASSFVVLNPNVADTTGVLAQYGSTLGKVATGCKIGYQF